MDEDSQALRLLAVEEFLENIKAECLSTVLWCVCGAYMCVLTKTALRFPSTWLSFRQLSPWLKAPNFLYLRAFSLEKTCNCKFFLCPLEMCIFYNVGMFYSRNCKPSLWNRIMKIRVLSQSLWEGRNPVSVNCNEHQLANTDGLITWTNLLTNG